MGIANPVSGGAFAFYLLAGVAFVGGNGLGYMAITRAQQERARAELQRNREYLRQALLDEISLEEVREQARRAGVDPAAVEEGYRAYLAGEVTFEQIRKMMEGEQG